jgi:hypothetical protein
MRSDAAPETDMWILLVPGGEDSGPDLKISNIFG